MGRVGITTKPTVLWLSQFGETLELKNQPDLQAMAQTEWCNHPWVLHVFPKGKKSVTALSLHDTAQNIFFRYDVNRDGQIDQAELGRMMNDLDRDYINTSRTLVNKFVEYEFSRLDTDSSGGLDLQEFIAYVDTMTAWMRAQ
eukprot:1945411-Prymnesium_polylepis.1